MDAAVSDPVAVTPKAAAKIASLAGKQGVAPVLRLRVVAGGCSGFSYRLSFDEPREDDHVVPAVGDVRVLIDPVSSPIVRGSTLDLDENLLGGGLRVRNPQAIHECACGESFGV